MAPKEWPPVKLDGEAAAKQTEGGIDAYATAVRQAVESSLEIPFGADQNELAAH